MMKKTVLLRGTSWKSIRYGSGERLDAHGYIKNLSGLGMFLRALAHPITTAPSRVTKNRTYSFVCMGVSHILLKPEYGKNGSSLALDAPSPFSRWRYLTSKTSLTSGIFVHFIHLASICLPLP